MVLPEKLITPNYIDRLLCQNTDIHERVTRYSSMSFMCPRFTRKTEGGRTFTVRSSIEWNSIDIDIRKKKSVVSFKCNLYKSCLDEQKATMIMSLLLLFKFLIRLVYSTYILNFSLVRSEGQEVISVILFTTVKC